MRSLWTAATGMSAQQLNIDTISNNLANVNTTAYKKERTEFKSLLYQTMQRADLDPANAAGRPVNLQVGLGVRPAATVRAFDVGNFQATLNKLDLAIEGHGFFVVQTAEDTIAYTRDGAFKLSITDEGRMLVTAEGYPILGIDDTPIFIPDEIEISALSISFEGNLSYMDAQGIEQDLDLQIALVQFSNTLGLEALGGNLYGTTVASGEAIYEYEGGLSKLSRLVQGYLEMSNVQVAEEMVSLIVAQRAYELSSKAITTSDEMLQTANNLKR